jgi:Rieske Fe-S protein
MPEHDDASAPPSGEEGCTRRRILNSILASGAIATGGAIAYPLAGFLLPPAEPESSVASVVAGKVSEFPLNSGKIVRMGSRPVILLRLASGEFRAFSAVCTHLSCRVQYRPDTRLIWCACHNGTFDLTGKNIAGPPPRPLEAYAANVRGDEVVISREAG